ncbi:MAG: hypothetical protein JWO00_456 [Candidatus Parcubacteria bacterium]|nr:hypothetical protein [Candidatus Parcubacteria bacterium]
MIIKKTARFIALAALFLIPVFPFIVANSYYFPFITGKAFYFRILVEVAFAAWLILAFIDARYRPRLTKLTIAVTVFAIVTLVADLAGVNPLRSLWSNFERMEGWMTIIHLWAFFIVSSSVFGSSEEGRRSWHQYLNIELVVAVIVGAYGFAQLFGWAAIHQGSTRIDASLGNAAYMAVYMLINAGIAAYMYFVARANKIANAGFLAWLYPILAIAFGFEVFQTATRGTILGLVGGVLLALFLYAVLGKNEPRKRRISAGTAIAVIVLVAIGFWSARNTKFVQNSEVLGRLANISWNETKTQARSYVWPMALTGFSQRPVLGWGQENFNYVFNANYNPKMWSQEQWFDRAHSVYLDWLTASGLVGLLAYLALYVLFLTGVWKSSLTVAEKSVLTGLLAGYAIHNIFVFDNLASYFLFFTLLAFVDSLRPGREIAWMSRASVSPEAVEYIATPIVVVALVAVLYVFNVRPMQANTQLISALLSCSGPQPDPTLFQNALGVNAYVANQETREQAMSCALSVINQQQIPSPTKEAFYELSTKSIDDQIKVTPNDARVYALAGSFYDSISQFDKGEALLVTAHKLSPAKQTIDLELANSYINTGSADKAIALLAPAYEAAPDNTQVASVYALALIVAGKEAQAHQLFGDDRTIFETPAMAQAYMYLNQYAKAIAIDQSLLLANPTDLNLAVALAQAQYKAGMIAASVATLRQAEKDHPEYKTQIEAAIEQVQSGK